ncbi:MAG TPA: LemA family protein [Candidatus Norongarragalinales archaeon]|jgi:LemA protein|nr:LemA family protein [Candidatus Norongarragalinales archaeon]
MALLEWIILGIIGLVLVVVIYFYNKLVSLNNLAQADWKNIDTYLQQRLDTIPNLVAIAKRVMKQETELFTGLAKARESAQQATDAKGRIAANTKLDNLLANFYARAEAYPQMRSNEAMQRVMEDLRGIEDKIRSARGAYNNSVLAYINAVTMFPSSAFANVFGFKSDKWNYYEADAAARSSLKLDKLLK